MSGAFTSPSSDTENPDRDHLGLTLDQEWHSHPASPRGHRLSASPRGHSSLPATAMRHG